MLVVVEERLQEQEAPQQEQVVLAVEAMAVKMEVERNTVEREVLV